MYDHTTATDSTPAKDRETNGRFAKGNHLGSGNPFARQVAALRAALLETVTAQDIKEIAHILLLNAKAGDLTSIKLLFQYAIGKPQPAVDPDSLDRDEMKAFQQETLQAQEMEALRSGAPLGAVLPMHRVFVEAQEAQISQALGEQFRAWEKEHPLEPEAHGPAEEASHPVAPETTSSGVKQPRAHQPAAHEAPSPNGFDGEWTEPAPSTNGQKSDGTATLFRWLRDLSAAQQPASGA